MSHTKKQMLVSLKPLHTLLCRSALLYIQGATTFGSYRVLCELTLRSGFLLELLSRPRYTQQTAAVRLE